MHNSPYRERFAATLAHKPVDRCPIDLDGTPQSTTYDGRLVRALADHLGIEGEPPPGPGKMDERILRRFDVDFRRVGELISYKTGRERRVSDTERVDAYGFVSKFTVDHWERVGGPLEQPTRDAVEAYEFPRLDQAVDDFDDLAARAKTFYEQTPYVVVGEHPVFGVLELACWLCGYEQVMMMLALEPDTAHLLFGKILEFQKPVIREYYGRLGHYIHLTTSGDDFGTQQGLFMSPDMWREFVKPYMAERIACTAQFTDAVYMHHSCGGIYEIIPDLIEIGVRVLNPIQPAAKGMDPARLKADYGSQITFHGGLDTQIVLPSGNARVIREAVVALIEVMRPNDSGGYIFAPAHNLQSDVTAASVAEMYTAALDFKARSRR